MSHKVTKKIKVRCLISSSICVTSGLLLPFLNGKKGGRGASHFSPALFTLFNFAHRTDRRCSVGVHLQIGLTDDICFSDPLLRYQHHGPTTLPKVRIWVSVKSGMCLFAVILPVWAQETKGRKPGSFSRSRLCPSGWR